MGKISDSIITTIYNVSYSDPTITKLTFSDWDRGRISGFFSIRATRYRDQGTYPVKVCINDVLSVSLDSIVFPFTDQIKRKPFHYTVWSSRNRRGVSRNRTITLRGDKKEEEEKMIRSFKPISHLKLCRKTIFSVTSCDNFPRFGNAPFFRPFHIVVLFHNVFFPSSLHDVCSCHGIISPAVYSAFRIQKRIQSGVETGQELSSTARNEGKVGRSEGFPLDGQLGA